MKDTRNTNDSEGADEPKYPMRINKYLAMQGRGSRREMDVLVGEGKVMVNGTPAVLGQKVDEGDKIEIRFRGPKGPRPAHG
ncbi:MAG: S4 domain-containing protein [bacterium]|nr:S4 domain-containing protein [bacterium]